jgi:hypothetical protein
VEYSIGSELNKRTFALQNDEENTKVLPLKPNKHPRAMVSMLEIVGHVAVMTIHLIEKMELKQIK